MNVLVIGGTRFIGPRVVERLIGAGHEVTLFNRGLSSVDAPEGASLLLGDRRRLAEHADELRRLAPEVVLDMIPMNEHDARGVPETFGGVAERVVAISSQDVYRAYDMVRGLRPGPPDPVPLSEDAPLRESLYPYGREGVEEYEKILVEKVVMTDPNLPGTVLRLPAVYGPGDYQHRLFPYLKRMNDGRPAILLDEGMASWRWTHGYVEDVAAAIALAVTDERAAGRMYNVGEENPPRWAQRVREIGQAAGWSGEIVEAPKGSLPDNPMAGLDTNQHWVADTSRIRRELGYEETVPRDEALRSTVAWEREHPPGEIEPNRFDYTAEDAILAAL